MGLVYLYWQFLRSILCELPAKGNETRIVVSCLVCIVVVVVCIVVSCRVCIVVVLCVLLLVVLCVLF